MTFKRLWQTFRLYTIRGGAARVEYIRKRNVYGAIGENCTIQKRKVPLYANLIRLGNNVHIASNVSFLTHDVTLKAVAEAPGYAESDVATFIYKVTIPEGIDQPEGDPTADPVFTLHGMKVEDALKAKVDGRTGATFSSDALRENVKLALEYYKKNK